MVFEERQLQVKPGSRRRGHIGIMGDFLDAIAILGPDGATPTKIMYRANLSWAMLTALAQSFVAAGFIIHDITRSESSGKKGRVLYRLTEEGRRVRDNYKELKEELLPLYRAYRANNEHEGFPGR
jgi:predicted transcriptional regulator